MTVQMTRMISYQWLRPLILDKKVKLLSKEEKERIYLKKKKRERRKIKKENKLLFKDVKKQQAAQKINVQNTKGIKLI
ncbi:hypothetical protein CEXT_64171 [Caerostris extrusa]|uniref:Uncharacterized protein n=1 Tax=Caerostris extrusa TaxID=172846 RepID=A0AAV4Q6R0_CAEEX|nr:hypothetical protein CEXT_64171 [Caerostris extrusa]